MMKILLDRDYRRMKLGFLGDLRRYAVVGGRGRQKDWVNPLRPYARIELRHFEAADESSAGDWFGAKPLVDRPVAA